MHTSRRGKILQEFLPGVARSCKILLSNTELIYSRAGKIYFLKKLQELQ